MSEQAYFVRTGGASFQATEHTAGPWDPRLQHAGPPSALLGAELSRVAASDGLVWARMTFEILGAVPVGPLEVEASVTRPGKRVQMSEATLTADGRVAVRARGWQVAAATADDAAPGGYVAPPRPEQDAAIPDDWESGYIHSIAWRYARGGFDEPGPAAAWTSPRVELVAGEGLDPLSRILVVADSSNGISTALPLTGWYFINPELSVHFLREPRGEWVCLDAETDIAHGGAGLAHSRLSDRDGVVAHAAQSLLVGPR